MSRKRKGKGKVSHRKSRKVCRLIGLAIVCVSVALSILGNWYVHHDREWLEGQRKALPSFIVSPLLSFGYPSADFTDAMGWTGHDAVYEYDTEAPANQILFAGLPIRVGEPAPNDIRVLSRGTFLIGWSDSLRHAVWCAYHVKKEAPYGSARRLGFTKDKEVPRAPSPNDYTKSGFDRGHMAPNHAIVTRYGVEEQRKTFMMSNITPQTPSLNRSVWRDVEHRIADLWTEKYGEIWVIVGCISSGKEKLPGTDIDIPNQFYQIIIAQEGMDVRALAFLFEQRPPWGDWPLRHIVSIDRIEELSGINFNPELPSFIQDPLESEQPTRPWPIKAKDIFQLFKIHYFH